MLSSQLQKNLNRTKNEINLYYCRINFLFTIPELVSISKKYIPLP